MDYNLTTNGTPSSTTTSTTATTNATSIVGPTQSSITNNANRLFDTDTESLLNEINNLQNTPSTLALDSHHQTNFYYNQQQAKYTMYNNINSTPQSSSTQQQGQPPPKSPSSTTNPNTNNNSTNAANCTPTTIQNVQINVQNNFNLAKNLNQANLNQFTNATNVSQQAAAAPPSTQQWNTPYAPPYATQQQQQQAQNYAQMYSQQSYGFNNNNNNGAKYPPPPPLPPQQQTAPLGTSSNQYPPPQAFTSQTPFCQQTQKLSNPSLQASPQASSNQQFVGVRPAYYNNNNSQQQRPTFNYPNQQYPSVPPPPPPPLTQAQKQVVPGPGQANMYPTHMQQQSQTPQNVYMNQHNKFTNYQPFNQYGQYSSYNQYHPQNMPPSASQQQPIYSNGSLPPIPHQSAVNIQPTPPPAGPPVPIAKDQNTPLKATAVNKPSKAQKASKISKSKNTKSGQNSSMDEGTNDSFIVTNSPISHPPPPQPPPPPYTSSQYTPHDPYLQYQQQQNPSFMYHHHQQQQQQQTLINNQSKVHAYETNMDYNSDSYKLPQPSIPPPLPPPPPSSAQSQMLPPQIRPIMQPPISAPVQTTPLYSNHQITSQQHLSSHTHVNQQSIGQSQLCGQLPAPQQPTSLLPPPSSPSPSTPPHIPLTIHQQPQQQNISQSQTQPNTIVHSQQITNDTNLSQCSVNNTSNDETKGTGIDLNQDKPQTDDTKSLEPQEIPNLEAHVQIVENKPLVTLNDSLDQNETLNNSSSQNQDSLNDDDDEEFHPHEESLNEVKPKRGRGRRPGTKNKSPKRLRDADSKQLKKIATNRRKTSESTADHETINESIREPSSPHQAPAHEASNGDDLITISSLSQNHDAETSQQLTSVKDDEAKPKRKYGRKKLSQVEVAPVTEPKLENQVQLGEDQATTADEYEQVAKKPRGKHRRKNTKQLASLLKKNKRKKRKLSSDEEDNGDDDSDDDEFQVTSARAQAITKSLSLIEPGVDASNGNDVSQSTGSYSIETDEQTAKALQANEKRRSARAATSKKQKYTLDDNAFKMAVLDDKVVVESDGDVDKEQALPTTTTNFALTTNDSFIVDKILGSRMHKRKLYKKKEKQAKVEEEPKETPLVPQTEQNGDVEMKDENEVINKETPPQVIQNKEEDKNEDMSESEEEEECGEIEVEEFYVKYKSISYLHSEWRTRDELFQTDKRIDQKIKRFKLKKSQAINFGDDEGTGGVGGGGEDEDELFNPDYVEIDRILDSYTVPDPNNPNGEHLTYYLVKWRVLAYEEATWEISIDLNKKKIERFQEINRPPSDTKYVPKPKLDRWQKMNESRKYKNGNTLREYQLEGINWLTYCWLQGRNAILADEMGLGKTVQSITFLQEVANYGVNGPFLVIVPLSTIGNWIREFETWTNFNVIVYHGSSISRNLIQDYEFYYKDHLQTKNLKNYPKFNALITTFEVLLSDVQLFAQFKWRSLIIDEAHRLKNKNCKLIEGLRYVDCEHKVLLTGTPLQNNVEELFSLLNYLEPEQFSSSAEFLHEFGDLKTDTQVQKLQAILKPMMLRRLKEDVEKNLAPKEETIIEVELTNIQKKYYRAILEKNFQFLSRGANTSNMPNLMNTMMELRKCCNHPYLTNGAEDQILADNGAHGQVSDDFALKTMIHSSGKLVLVDKLLPKLKAGGHKVLIFSQMIKVLDILEDYLIQMRFSYERIDGRIRGEMRQEAIDRFSKPDSDRFAFLLCTRAGGLGINLTAADTVIIYDSDWNPQNDLQAQARVHRIGQQKSVKIYRLVTRNTYEREMFDRASLKLGLDKAVLQSMRNDEKFNTNGPANAPMSKKEIEDLLKKGAYGAIMEDDSAADKFCEEDIDKILQQRATVVTIEGGEKGSTFSKASFSANETRSDISIDDPEFWQKWAKKADIDVDAGLPKDERIIYEPRRRTQTKRFGGPEDFDESESDSADSNEADENGNKKRGKKSNRKGQNKEDLTLYPPENAWARDECYKVEKNLLIYGWSQWSKILHHCKRANKKRIKDESDIENISRLILVYALQFYHGDEAIRQFISDLIDPSKSNDFKNHQGLAAPVPRGRKSKKLDEQPNHESNIILDSEWKRHAEDLIADENYKKHLVRQANKILLRVRMLFYIKQEIIGNEISSQIEENVNALDLDMLMPPIQASEVPAPWWDKECDKSLIIGVYKCGYEKYNQMRMDPCLCFLSLCGPPDAKDLLAEQQDDERGDQMEEDDGEYKPANEKRALKSMDDEMDDDETNEKTTLDSKKSTSSKNSSGKYAFPASSELNIRLRRIITTFQKHHKKEIQLSKRNAERQEKRMSKLASHQEKVSQRQLEKQCKWSRREETNFYRTISSFGVDYDKESNTYAWDRFRELGQLDKKLDETLTDYFNSFFYMCKKVCNKLADDEEPPHNDVVVEVITEERASRCLQRIDLLNRLRNEVKNRVRLDERIKLCKLSIDLPDWWVPVKHDRDLALAAAKYGINRTEHFYLNDAEFSFKEYLDKYMRHIESMIGDTKSDPIQYYFLNQGRIQSSFKELLDKSFKAKNENKGDETLKEVDDEPTKVDVSVESEPSQLQICEDDDDVEEKMEIVEESHATMKETSTDAKVQEEEKSRELEIKQEVKEEVKQEIHEKKIEFSIDHNDGSKSSGQSFPMIMWPKDRIIFNRLENIVDCLENNEWPEKAVYALSQSTSQCASDKAPASPIPSTASDFDNDQISNAGDFDTASASLKPSSSSTSSTNQKQQKPKRGRPPKLEDPSNKIRQMLTQMTTENENDLQLPLAELMNAAKNSIFAAAMAAGQNTSTQVATPLPSFLEPGEIIRKSSASKETKKSNGKSNKLPKPPAMDPLTTALSFFMQPGVDPDERIPVINMDGIRLAGDEAPKRSDLTDFLLQHPNFLPDQPDIYELAFGKRSSSVKPSSQHHESFNRSPSPDKSKNHHHHHQQQQHQQQQQQKQEQTTPKIQPDAQIANLNFINKLSGKRLNPDKRPPWKNLVAFLERNQDLYIDSSSVDIVKAKYGKNYSDVIRQRILPANFKSTQKSTQQQQQQQASHNGQSSSSKSNECRQNKSLNISIDSTSSTPNAKPVQAKVTDKGSSKQSTGSSKQVNKTTVNGGEPQITFPPLSPSMTSSVSMAGLNELLLQQAAAGFGNPLGGLAGYSSNGNSSSAAAATAAANSLGLPFGGLGFNPFLLPHFGASSTPFPPLDEFLKQFGNGSAMGFPKEDTKLDVASTSRESYKNEKKSTDKESKKEAKEKQRASTSSKKASKNEKNQQLIQNQIDTQNLADQEKFMQELMNFSHLASYPNSLFFNPLGFPAGTSSSIPGMPDASSSSTSSTPNLPTSGLDFSLLMNNPLLNPFLVGSGLPPPPTSGASTDGKLSMDILAAISAAAASGQTSNDTSAALDFLKPNDHKVKSKSSRTSTGKHSSSSNRNKLSNTSGNKSTAPSPAPSNESFQGLDLSIKKPKQNKEVE